MLYLEDYLELIEHLPLELRDRFTDIRERDLQVHNSSEQLREKVRNFFAEAKKLDPEQEQCEYNKLIKEYHETIKFADDKVHIAKQMHDIMVKLVQRLDTELDKFKLELEADHAGITEELEKHSLELDTDSRLDQVINNHLNESASSSSASHLKNSFASPHLHKDRRRSEFKQQRLHPYQNNNNYSNGYPPHPHHHHGQSKSLEHRTSSKTLNHNQQQHHLHHKSHGSKSSNNHHVNPCRQQVTPPISNLHNNNLYLSNPLTEPTPLDLNGSLNELTPSKNQYHNNLSSVSYGFKDPDKLQHSLKVDSSTFNQQHSALSAALSSNTPQLNSSSAMALINPSQIQQQNKISTNNPQKSVADIFEPDCPLVRQNPLVAAASQAIAATQQLQQGRRTPSLKASFAAINAAGLGPDSLNSSGKHDTFLGNNRNALAPMAPDHQASRYPNHIGKLNGIPNKNPLYVSVTKSGRPSKRPKHHAYHLFTDESPPSVSSDNSVFENSESLSSADFIETGTTFDSASPSSVDFSTNAARGNTTLYHRDETKYCVCRQISYGEMVACDNDECEIEWFHYDCVGVTQPPKGKWFCPECTRKMEDHSQPHNASQTQKKRGRKDRSIFNVVNSPLDAVRSK